MRNSNTHFYGSLNTNTYLGILKNFQLNSEVFLWANFCLWVTEWYVLRAATEDISYTHNLSPRIYVLIIKFTLYNHNHGTHLNGLHVFVLHSFTISLIYEASYWLWLWYLASYIQLTIDTAHKQHTTNKKNWMLSIWSA